MAEGNNGLLKSAFRDYRWVHPKYSQLYVNEFACMKAIKVWGIQALVDGKVDGRKYSPQEGFVGFPEEKCLSDILPLTKSLERHLYQPPSLRERQEVSQSRTKFTYNENLLTHFQGKRFERLRKAMYEYNSMYLSNRIEKRYRQEGEYTFLSELIWQQLKEPFNELKPIIDELNIQPIKAYRIVRIWHLLGLVKVTDRTTRSQDYQGKSYDLQRLTEHLPRVCYSLRLSELSSFKKEWMSSIQSDYHPASKRLGKHW